MNEWELLDQIRIGYQAVLGEKLTGMYVHGSIAFGCFRWDSSDIDFLAVVEEKLTQQEKERLISILLELDEHAPPKGFEMSVVERAACMPFADPTPYELHYSNAHRGSYRRDLAGTCRTLQGFDPDLAAHMTVTARAGIVLCGEPVERVFAPVPPECYLRSIWQDVRCAAEDIARDPVYHTLNLCRTLAYVQEGKVLSKQQGGEWGMAHLNGHEAVIAQALEAYQSGMPTPCGKELDGLAKAVLGRIRASKIFLEAGLQNN